MVFSTSPLKMWFCGFLGYISLIKFNSTIWACIKASQENQKTYAFKKLFKNFICQLLSFISVSCGCELWKEKYVVKKFTKLRFLLGWCACEIFHSLTTHKEITELHHKKVHYTFSTLLKLFCLRNRINYNKFD